MAWRATGSDVPLLAALGLALAWAAAAAGVPLVGTVVLGRGGHDHPHGTGVLWAAIAVVILLGVWLGSLVLRVYRRDRRVRRKAMFAVTVAAVLAVVPPYTIVGVVVAAIFVPFAAAALWLARREAHANAAH